jgi:hypothetical protein
MFFLLIAHNICAQDFITGNHINIQVGAICTKAKANSFDYNYTLFNKPTSEQRIWVFAVFTKTYRDSISNIKSPSWDYGIPKNEFFASVRWTPSDDLDLQPNSSANGFGIVGNGLPGIVDVYAEGYHEPPSFPDGMATDSIPGYSDLTPYGPGVVGKTIGPVLSPEPFVAINFLDTLLSYTRQSVELGWLKDGPEGAGRDNDCDPDEKPDDGIVKNLENRLLKARNELNEGSTVKASPIGAGRELEKFIKKVERISKHSDIMTSEAYALLKYNAEYLLEHLITLPPKPKGTLLQQIDSLKIELQNQSKKRNIGGAIFVKGLTLLIDQAKKQLQKQDSSETALYIALFQLVVDETWELTQKLEEKKKKLAALYVLDEAYIALHHRAEYILEALPEPRRSVHEQRQQMLEKDPSFREMQQELEKMEKSVE